MCECDEFVRTRKEKLFPTTRQLFSSVARSEWTKLRSVRSTVWALLVTVLITVGLGTAIGAVWVSRWDHVSAHDRLTFDPTGLSLSGVYPAQLAIGVLGVLIMSSEYATGQIRATLGATPQRGTLLAAKTAVFTAVVFVIGLVTCFVAFFNGQAFFSTKHVEAALSDPGALRAVIGGALYLAAIGTLAVGLGAILRRTAVGYRRPRRPAAGAAHPGGLPASAVEQRHQQVPPWRGRNGHLPGGADRRQPVGVDWLRGVVRLRGRGVGVGRRAAHPARRLSYRRSGWLSGLRIR